MSLFVHIPISDLSDMSCDVRPDYITWLRGTSYFKYTRLVCYESLYC
jgi:hypothetical protein